MGRLMRALLGARQIIQDFAKLGPGGLFLGFGVSLSWGVRPGFWAGIFSSSTTSWGLQTYFGEIVLHCQ